jgi:ribosomal protein L1
LVKNSIIADAFKRFDELLFKIDKMNGRDCERLVKVVKSLEYLEMFKFLKNLEVQMILKDQFDSKFQVKIYFEKKKMDKYH